MEGEGRGREGEGVGIEGGRAPRAGVETGTIASNSEIFNVKQDEEIRLRNLLKFFAL